MTRMPELERELVAAAQRRYGSAPRRRPSLRFVRVLAPAAAMLVLAVVAFSALRTTDPEVEAPASKPRPPVHVTLQELVQTPLGFAGSNLAAPGRRPVTLMVESTSGSRWTVVAFADPHMNGCIVAADGIAGANCYSAGTLQHQFGRRDPAWDLEAIGDGRVVYGLVGFDVDDVEVTLGSATRRARVHESTFVTRVTEEERRTNRFDGKPPNAGEVRARLFAAAFTSEEVPGDPDAMRARLRVTYADGRTVTSELPSTRPASTPPGCYREASLDSDVAAPTGSGTPVEICERFWRETGFEGVAAPERLTACEGSDSAPWVFPGGPDVCARLGLEPYR